MTFGSEKNVREGHKRRIPGVRENFHASQWGLTTNGRVRGKILQYHINSFSFRGTHAYPAEA
jgi:hypothetical protein